VEAPAPAPAPIETPAVPEPLAAKPVTPADLAQTAARKYSLPDAFVAGVMRAESGFNPAAVSPKGAIGLMQLMPDTARDLGVDPKNPRENADAGTRYLRDLLARYEDQPNQVELALAAYNAGPAAVDKYHGVPPYRETHEYILRVLKSWNPPQATPKTVKESSK
jgi:soluble lytic murein transglycosylase-like protein